MAEADKKFVLGDRHINQALAFAHQANEAFDKRRMFNESIRLLERIGRWSIRGRSIRPELLAHLERESKRSDDRFQAFNRLAHGFLQGIEGDPRLTGEGMINIETGKPVVLRPKKPMPKKKIRKN